MNKNIKVKILKKIKADEKEFSEKDFEISKNEFQQMLSNLKEDDLIHHYDYYLDNSVDYNTLQLTSKGEDYLSSKSISSKVFNFIKGLMNFIK